jgi:hypothetical protein
LFSRESALRVGEDLVDLVWRQSRKRRSGRVTVQDDDRKQTAAADDYRDCRLRTAGRAGLAPLAAARAIPGRWADAVLEGFCRSTKEARFN